MLGVSFAWAVLAAPAGAQPTEKNARADLPGLVMRLHEHGARPLKVQSFLPLKMTTTLSSHTTQEVPDQPKSVMAARTSRISGGLS